MLFSDSGIIFCYQKTFFSPLDSISMSILFAFSPSTSFLSPPIQELPVSYINWSPYLSLLKGGDCPGTQGTRCPLKRAQSYEIRLYQDFRNIWRKIQKHPWARHMETTIFTLHIACGFLVICLYTLVNICNDLGENTEGKLVVLMEKI